VRQFALILFAVSAAHAVTISQPGFYRQVSYTGQVVVGGVRGVTLEACVFTHGPVTPDDSGAHLIVASNASDVWIVGCTFDGSAYRAILSRGRDVHVVTSGVLGSAQNLPTSPASFFSDGIKFTAGGGTLEVRDCRIRNVGGMGVLYSLNTVAGDRLIAQGNTIEACGQAGVSAWKTRGFGTGLIRGNRISGCNRLAGTPGAGGNGACGIHLNDGEQAGVNLNSPFLRWTVIENTVYGCAAPAAPRHEDSGGIAIDFNANNALVEGNTLYGNWGKGLYVYNADGCTVRGNLVYGNDSGIVVSSGGLPESAAGNVIANNLCYRNWNGPRGPGYDCELLIFRTAGTYLSGNAYFPEPGKRGVWDMGLNTGFAQVGNLNIAAGAPSQPVATATPTPTPTATFTATPTPTPVKRFRLTIEQGGVETLNQTGVIP